MPKLKLFLALALLLLAGQAGANPHLPALSGPTVGSSGGCNYTLKDSATDGFIYITGGNESARKYVGQSFTATDTYYLCKLGIELYKNNSPTMTITVYIYSDSGGTGPNAQMAQSTSTIDAATLPVGAGTYTEVNFNGTYQIQNGVKYWVVLMASAVDGTNNFRWYSDTNQADQACYIDADGAGAWSSLDATSQGDFKSYD